MERARLRTKLDDVSRSVEQNDSTGARAGLRAFLQELEAEHPKHINDDAYWILKMNSGALLRRFTRPH